MLMKSKTAQINWHRRKVLACTRITRLVLLDGAGGKSKLDKLAEELKGTLKTSCRNEVWANVST